MVTLGVDPGAEAGIAACVGADLVYAQDVRKVGESDPWVRILAIQAALRASGLRITAGGRLMAGRFGLALEAQFGRPATMRSALKVAGHASTWECSGACVGGSACEVLPRVVPSTWQALLGAAKGPSKERKARARAAVLERWPHLEHLRQGAIDAVWIAVTAHIKRGATGWEWVDGIKEQQEGDR